MSMQRQQNVSEATAQTIDAEVRRLVDEGYAEATRILTEHKDQLETLARGLLEYETLSGDEIVNLLDGHPPVRDTTIEPAHTRGSVVPTARQEPPAAPDAGMEPQPQA